MLSSSREQTVIILGTILHGVPFSRLAKDIVNLHIYYTQAHKILCLILNAYDFYNLNLTLFLTCINSAGKRVCVLYFP